MLRFLLLGPAWQRWAQQLYSENGLAQLVPGGRGRLHTSGVFASNLKNTTIAPAVAAGRLGPEHTQHSCTHFQSAGQAEVLQIATEAKASQDSSSVHALCSEPLS